MAVDSIYFSSNSKQYSFLSNSYISDLTINGETYYHVEGYFLSTKFKETNSKLATQIKYAYSSIVCRKITKEELIPQEKLKEWNDTLALKTMKRAILVKFLTSDDLFSRLINTGSRELINNDLEDEYWGCGKDKKGSNVLGKVLMGVRTILQSTNSSVGSTDVNSTEEHTNQVEEKPTPKQYVRRTSDNKLKSNAVSPSNSSSDSNDSDDSTDSE